MTVELVVAPVSHWLEQAVDVTSAVLLCDVNDSSQADAMQRVSDALGGAREPYDCVRTE